MKYKIIMNNGNEYYIKSDEGVYDFAMIIHSTEWIEVENYIKNGDNYNWCKKKILLSIKNISEVIPWEV